MLYVVIGAVVVVIIVVIVINGLRSKLVRRRPWSQTTGVCSSLGASSHVTLSGCFISLLSFSPLQNGADQGALSRGSCDDYLVNLGSELGMRAGVVMAVTSSGL